MKVSVITPTFRRTQEVLEASRSVLKIQDLSLEHLICDDCPEHSASVVLKQLQDNRVQYDTMPSPTGGFPGKVRNYMATKAQGEYLYFLDDDDRVNPATLPLIIEKMDEQGASVAIGDVDPFGDHTKAVLHEVAFFARASRILARGPSAKTVAAQMLFKNPILVCSACVVRRDAFFALGGFDDNLTPFEDTEFFLRAIRSYGYTYIPLPLLERRCGDTCLSATVSPERIKECYQKMRAKYRERYGFLEHSYLRLTAKFGFASE